MSFGLTQEELNYILEAVITPLKSEGAKVWCFGSRANGTQNKFSDLDLMIETTQDLTLMVGNIKETLSNGNFPYKVDLVLLSDFAASYLEQFEKEKVLL